MECEGTSKNSKKKKNKSWLMKEDRKSVTHRHMGTDSYGVLSGSTNLAIMMGHTASDCHADKDFFF